MLGKIYKPTIVKAAPDCAVYLMFHDLNLILTQGKLVLLSIMMYLFISPPIKTKKVAKAPIREW